ncbi:MAG: leucine-rich repeat domain-containing protein, partial [Allobaculum sp.]|nr:leucine-rich repeat domain-containing protein [Allobaculum sp.]
MRKLIFMLIILWTAMTASAYDFEYNYLKYSIIDRETRTCRIDGRVHSMWGWDEIILSEVPDGETTYTVTAIGEGAFAGYGWDRKLEIPHTITEIGRKAFMYCDIGSIVLPEHLTEIAYSLFFETRFRYLRSEAPIHIPNGVKRIGTRAFYNCEEDPREIVLPESVTEIGEAAFHGYLGIHSLNLPGLTEINDSILAFTHVSSIT